MSLVDGKQIFISGLVALQQQMITKETESFQHFAEKWADLIVELVKSADVKTGIFVSTTGSATAQTGQTTSKGKLE